MNAERLVEAFNRLGDEPETVQRVRKLVIGLAMSGKLVARDEVEVDPPNLLKQIEAKRRTLIQQGVLEKQSSLVVLSHEDLPKGFNNPGNFVRLGNLARIEKGLTGITKAEPGPYPLVVTAEDRASCDHFDFDGAAAIVPLVSSAGHGKASLQRLHYQEGKFALGSILAAIFPYAPEFVSARFLFEYLTTFKEELLVSQMIGTANVSLNISKVSDVPVPLVSQSVQRKVDELMAVCDRLEAARAEREAKRDRLSVAILARLNAPDPETFEADARFALDSLPAVTTRPDQIKALRQTILSLAVRGKLVQQDPCDEPASELLERIARTKRELLRTKKLKSNIPITNSVSMRESIELPDTWQWASCDELFFVTKLAGFEYTKHFEPTEEGEVPIIRAQNVRPWAIEEINLKYIPLRTSLILERSAVTKPCILITFIGAGIGDVALIDTKRRWHLAPNVAKAELFEGCGNLVNLKYVVMFFNSPVGRAEIFKHIKTTAQPSLSMGTIRDVDVLVPPLPEQHRIVAKVDALMVLCDRLETSLTATAATRRRLLDALVAEALAPTENRELEAAE
jgi:type I restriction enzyme, S subunit